MTELEFSRKVKELVAEYTNQHLDNTDYFELTTNEVYILWMCKILQNNKALASTSLFDGMYYEITYNGNTKEIYLDAYKKWENKCIKIEENTND